MLSNIHAQPNVNTLTFATPKSKKRYDNTGRQLTGGLLRELALTNVINARLGHHRNSKSCELNRQHYMISAAGTNVPSRFSIPGKGVPIRADSTGEFLKRTALLGREKAY